MTVSAVLTNGSLITEELLDDLLRMGCRPTFKISFDGIGKHDWMRGVTGAEKDTIRAISLCVKKGFEVCAHVCVNAENENVLLPTAKMLNDLGVNSMRIIRTSESARWMITSPESTLSPDQYFDTILDFTGKYIASGCRMVLNLWSILVYYPGKRKVVRLPEPCLEDGERLKSHFICGNMRAHIFVSADGGLFPCHAIVGPMRSSGMEVPSIFQKSVREIIADDEWMRIMHPRISDLLDENQEGRDCKYLRYCMGGCRAVAFVMTEKIAAKDPMKCSFFNDGYYDRMNKLLDNI